MSLTMVASPYVAHALPSGHQVQYGQLDISAIRDQLNIDQLTPQAIANWESFSIGNGQLVNIEQLSADSILLNRVVGANPSELYGQINANGRVYLVNPNGVVVGPEATINAAEFLASTLDVSDQDFLNGGDLLFTGDSTQSVINFGEIKAANGDVILLAYHVVNEGEIEAPQGVASLGAGNEVILSPESNQRIFIKTDLSRLGDGVGVDNSGVIEAAQAELKAAGGSVYSLAINQQGIVQATGLEEKNGRILITAEEGDVFHSGTLSANNADGSGGEVLLGGDYRGENEAIANARNTVVSADGVIDVSAIADDADAGRAIIWADKNTRFLGTIEGQGGINGGDGAFAEVSGKEYLDFRGFADLEAPQGTVGQLLLDPASLTIQATGPDSSSTPGGDPFVFENTDDTGSVLSVSTLESQLASSDVTLVTSVVQDGPTPSSDSSIVVNDVVTWNSGNTLTFNSGGDIIINESLNGGAGNIDFGLGFQVDEFIGGINIDAKLVVDAGADITADTVTIKRFFSGDFVGNSTDGFIGEIDINGILNVDILDIQYAANSAPVIDGFGSPEPSGIAGATSIDNPNNAIGTLKATMSSGTINDSFTIVDGSDGLIIDGQFKDIRGDVSITTNGNLTLNPGAIVSAAATTEVSVGFPPVVSTEPTDFDVTLAAQGGSFINKAGANPVSAGANGRFLIYSSNPTDTEKDGLVGDPVYNKTYAANAPATITQTGNRFLYSLAPTLTLTANNTSKTQGDPNPTFTFSTSGLVGGDQAADVFTGAPSLSTTATDSSTAGNYSIDIAQNTVVLSDFGYSLSLLPGVLSIDPVALQQLIISANNTFRTYGDSNPEFTASYDGFTSGQDESLISGLEFETTATQQSAVGSYDITPFGATADGFNIVFQPGTLRIDPRLLTVTVGDTSKIFGDNNPNFTFEFENLASFDDNSVVAGLSTTSTASRLSDVGDYPITIQGSVNGNYMLDPVAGNLEITPRPVTITARDTSREYGESNPTFTTSTTQQVSGAPLGNTGLTFTTVAESTSDVGIYTVTPSGIINNNYEVTYLPGDLSITAAPLTLSAQNLTREYGLANPELIFTDGSNYKLSDTIDDVFDNFTITTAATQESNVGAYLIDLAGDIINTNYDVTLNDATFTITKAPLFVVPALSSRFYGDPNPTSYGLSATGLRNDDTEAVVVQERFQNFTPLNQSAGNAGSVSLISGTATNYTLSFGTGTMNILPRPLTITADSFVREYGEANPSFTATFDNLASFHDESVITGLTFTTPATQASNALRYGITPSSNPNSNYAISYEQGFLDITKAPLTVTLTNSTRIYGNGNDFALSQITFDEGFGFKLDDDLNGLSLENVTTTATQQSGIGNYPVTAEAISPNYEVEITGVPLMSVTPRPLTALINLSATERTRMYGDANIDLTDNVLVGNLANADPIEEVLSIVDSTIANTPIGEYSWDASIIDPNYTLESFGNENFFIQQRKVDLLFNPVSRVYGESDPDLFPFLNFDFLAPGDTLATVLTTPTASTAINSDVGDYPITTSSISSNYFVNSITGNLSITPRTLFVTLNPLQRIYGNENPINYDSFRVMDQPFDILPFDNLQSIMNIHAPAPGDDVGEYDLTAEMVSNNYDLLSFNGSMTVNQRQITILAPESVQRIYGDSNPIIDDFEVLTPAGSLNSGLASFDTVDDVVTFEAPDIEADVAAYTLRELSDLNTNYDISLVGEEEFRFNVNPRPIYLDFAGLTRVFGQENATGLLTDVTPSQASAGLTSFDTLDDAVTLILPSVEADVGVYSAQVESRNYDVDVSGEPLQVTIEPRRLLIAANDYTRFYGNEAEGVRITPLLGSPGREEGITDFHTKEDVFEVTFPAIDAKVGVYDMIDPFNTNYDISFVNTVRSNSLPTVTVEPRLITVNSGAFTRLFGNENPSSGISTLVGDPSEELAPFHNQSDVFTLSEVPSLRTPAGAYSIFDFVNSNYDISITGDESFTIEKRPLFLFASNYSINYGTPIERYPIRNTYSTNGTLDGPASFDTIDSIVRPNLPPAGTQVGRYDITLELLSPNYTINHFIGNLETLAPPYVQFNPISLKVELPGYDRFYGEDNIADQINIVQGELPAITSLRDVFGGVDVPEPGAAPGTYVVAELLDTKNFIIQVLSGEETMTISPRKIGLNFDSYQRLYGDENPGLGDIINLVFESGIPNAQQGIASFDELEDVFVFTLPDERAVAGSYSLGFFPENPNYDVSIFSDGVNRGSLLANATINQRFIDVDVSDLFGVFGDTSFDVDFNVSGRDGLASFDTASDVIQSSKLNSLSQASRTGYYLIDDFSVDASKYSMQIDPAVFTVLPRQVTLNIEDDSLSFESVAELNDYLANENLVVDASVSNLRTGDTIDDAFPIIRYQVVDSDEVPQLPIIPTEETVEVPSIAALVADPDLIASGVDLKDSAVAPSSGTVTRTANNFVEGDLTTLSRFLTIFDGFNTERDYVLSAVNNGSIEIQLPTIVTESPDYIDSETGFIISSTFKLSEPSVIIPRSEKLVVMSGKEVPPSLNTLFENGDFKLGIDMIRGLVDSLLGDGSTTTFEEGSLLFEITRNGSGDLADITDFRIQRWFERNADNPEYIMTMLAEPLSHYSTEFLKKDPTTYTDQESQFADLLSEHLEYSQHEIADRMQEKREAWEAAETANGANMADLFGKDVPWSDFMEGAASEYVTENIEAKIAATAGSAAIGGVAVGGVMLGLTSSVLPFAVTGGASIIAGATVTGVGTTVTATTVVAAGTTASGGTAVATAGGVAGSAALSAGAAVVFPVAIVSGAIVGSVVRGIQVIDNEKQRKTFEDIQNNIGAKIDPSDFKLQDAKGNENPVNQTIMLGALANMLFGR